MLSDEELKISVKVQKGRDVRKFSFKRYIPPHKSFTKFFDNLVAEIKSSVDMFLDEILRR